MQLIGACDIKISVLWMSDFSAWDVEGVIDDSDDVGSNLFIGSAVLFKLPNGVFGKGNNIFSRGSAATTV